jgi:hypothetical protein
MDFQCLHCHHLHHCPQGLCRCHCKHPGRNEPATSRREMPVHLYHLEVCVVDWPHSGLPACWHFQLVLRLVPDGQWLLRGEDWLMRWLCMHISKIGETKREKKNGTCPAHLGDAIAASCAIRSAFFLLIFKPCSRHSTCNCFTARLLLQKRQRMRTSGDEEYKLTWYHLPGVWWSS